MPSAGLPHVTRCSTQPFLCQGDVAPLYHCRQFHTDLRTVQRVCSFLLCGTHINVLSYNTAKSNQGSTVWSYGEAFACSPQKCHLWTASLWVEDVGDIIISPLPLRGSHLSPAWRTPSPVSQGVTGAGPVFTLPHTDESPAEHRGLLCSGWAAARTPTCPRLPSPVPRLLPWEPGASERGGCCRRGERGLRHRLFLRQCFKRRFWLPLHFVRNLILSACAVSSCMPTAASSPAGPGAAAAPLGEQSAGSGPAPLGRPIAPAPAGSVPAPAGSVPALAGSVPAPIGCHPGTRAVLPRHSCSAAPAPMQSCPRALQAWHKGPVPRTRCLWSQPDTFGLGRTAHCHQNLFLLI